MTDALLRKSRSGSIGLPKAIPAKPAGEGVSEMRIDYGPGYRVYYTMRGRSVLLLLIGGDKSSQASDIQRAKALARGWEKPR